MTVTQGGSDAVVSGFIGDWPGDLGERPRCGSRPAPSRPRGCRPPPARRASATPLAGQFPGRARRPPTAQRRAVPAELGGAARPAGQPHRAGRGEPARWGSLRLALPVVGDSDASYLAAEAVAAAPPRRAHPPPPAWGRSTRWSPASPGSPTTPPTPPGPRCAPTATGRGAGTRHGHHRTASLPTVLVDPRRQERRRLVAAARPGRAGRLPHRAAVRDLAVRGTGERGQRVRPVHAQTGAAG